MSLPKVIGLIGSSQTDEAQGLLAALTASYGLQFRRVGQENTGGLDGLILLDSAQSPVSFKVPANVPSIRVIQTECNDDSAMVGFEDEPITPFPFRDRKLQTGCAVPAAALLDESDQVLARAYERPLWTTSSPCGVRQDTCWVPSPWIRHGECAFHHLNGKRFLNLLPLIEWLRCVSGWHEFQHPTLRACFLFDDPNLHAKRYGHVEFAELATVGRHHGFHTAFATVPLDGYYVNKAAASLFRANHETLSLMIHGNNHTYRELANHSPAEEQLAQMQQAVSRIKRLEEKAGCAVSRVMAPPHGVCSAEMMSAMKHAGLEAVCVSHGSVWTGNPGVDWAISLGLSPALLVEGLPVIPRFGLDRNLENQVLLAAYLHQPIIPVGHHWDLAEGTNILASAANIINGLGKVNWCCMTAIARSNYHFRVRHNIMRIETFSRVTTVTVPDSVSEIEVVAPWLDTIQERIFCQSSNVTGSPQSTIAHSGGFRFHVEAGNTVEITISRQPAYSHEPYHLAATPFRAVVRRVLTELRDRMMYRVM